MAIVIAFVVGLFVGGAVTILFGLLVSAKDADRQSVRDYAQFLAHKHRKSRQADRP